MNIFKCGFLLFFILTYFSKAEETPVQIVGRFYSCLDDAAGTNNPDLFEKEELKEFYQCVAKKSPLFVSESKKLDVAWRYFREHKDIFIKPRDSAVEFWKNSGKWYMTRSYVISPSNQTYSLNVVIVSDLKFSDRLFKHVEINFKKNTEGWKMSPLGIWVNGVGIDIEGYKRDQDLYELLGFRKSTNASSESVTTSTVVTTNGPLRSRHSTNERR